MTSELLAACRSDGPRSSTTAYMRSFLRYLFWTNLNAHDRAQFVARTPCWRHNTIMRAPGEAGFAPVEERDVGAERMVSFIVASKPG